MSVDAWAMEIYEDVMCTIPVITLHFGQTWAGETKTKTIYMKNRENGDVMDITYEIDRNDVSIIGPSEIARGMTEKLEVVWSPSKDSVGINTNINISAVLIS